MDEYTAAVIIATVGFFALAAILLVPVWRFLKREEAASEEWTHEALAARLHTDDVNGSVTDDPDPDPDER